MSGNEMDRLKEPLIHHNNDKASDDGTPPSVSVTASEDNSLEDNHQHKERISSFMDTRNSDIPRTTNYPPTVSVTMRNGKRRGVTVPSSSAPPELGVHCSPRSSHNGTGESKKQSVIVAGDDHFILEEPNPDSFQATGKDYIDGRHSTGLGVSSEFVNVHVSFSLVLQNAYLCVVPC